MKNYLVKVLLNEKEVHISALSQKTFYYSWDALRSLYINKLNSLNVKLTDNMDEFLLSLKP